MTFRFRWGRILRAAGIGVLVLVAGLAAYVQIQQRILRWRAERLLADIREIQMGKSTWADAQRLMSRWGEWGGYQNECNQKYCSYKISIDDVSRAFHDFPFLDGGQWDSQLRWPQWMNGPYTWAGGRFAVVEARFEVRNGAIWGKSFAIRTAFSKWAYEARSRSYAAPDSNVIAEGICTPVIGHRGFLREPAFSIDNPELSFSLTDNDREGHWAVAAFTPFADGDMVNALLKFNLDCITRTKECRTVSELMPVAVSSYKAGVREANKSANENYLKDLPLWVAARDAEFVAVAEAIGMPRHPRPDRRALSFQVTKLLKGDVLISTPSSVYTVRMEGAKERCSVPYDVARNFRNGTKVLIVLDEPLNEEFTPKPDASACVVFPQTAENLAAVQRGISRYTVLYPAIWGSDQ